MDNIQSRPSETQVTGTNDSSIISKLSTIQSGYFDDSCLQCFVSSNTPIRRTSLIHRGYYIRMKSMDHLYRNVFKRFNKEPLQVVSFGAGFDSAYFRYKANKNDEQLKASIKDGGENKTIENGNNEQILLPSNICYIEIDFHSVIKRKVELIDKQKLLGNLSLPLKCDKTENSVLHFYSDDHQYHLIATDLSNTDQFVSAISNFHILNTDVTTLFIAECSIIYMDPSKSSNLIQWAASQFTLPVFATYEQLIPDDAFGRVMRRHFEILGAPLRSIHLYGTSSDQCKRYKDCGFTVCRVLGMNNFYNSLSCEERFRINKLEQFDEWEEWHLMCSHYALVVAGNDRTEYLVNDIVQSNIDDSVESPPREMIANIHWLKNNNVCKRFGHSTIFDFKQSNSITLGGFGIGEGGRHCRISDVEVHKLSILGFLSDAADHSGLVPNVHHSFSFERLQNCFKWSNYLMNRMYHAHVQLSNDRHLIIGGRTSPLKPCHDAIILSNENLIRVQMEAKPRWRHTVTKLASVNEENYCTFLLFGGKNANEIFSDAWIITVSDDNGVSWKLLTNDENVRPCARFSHSFASNKQICVLSGGLDQNENVLNDLWMFDNYQSSAWKRLNVIGFQCRYSHTSHVIDNKLYAIGGVSRNPYQIPGLAVVNLDTLICNEYQLPSYVIINEVKHPVMFHRHSSILFYDSEHKIDENNKSIDKKYILVFGGGGNCFSFGTHINQTVAVICV